MELPGTIVHFLRLLPPAVRADDVDAAIAVDIAVAQAVVEAVDGWDILAFFEGAADGDALPGLGRIIVGDEVAHFTAVVVVAFLRSFSSWRIPAHDEIFLARLEQIDVDRRLVAGAVGQQVRLPLAALGAGVFVPVAWVAGEGNDDHVGPAIAVSLLRGIPLFISGQIATLVQGLDPFLNPLLKMLPTPSAGEFWESLVASAAKDWWGSATGIEECGSGGCQPCHAQSLSVSFRVPQVILKLLIQLEAADSTNSRHWY